MSTDVSQAITAAPTAVRPRGTFPFATVALYVFLTLYCIASLFPMIWVLLSSFKSNTEIFSAILALPTNWSFDNFIKAWNGAAIGSGMINTVLVTVPTLVIVLLFGSMAAYVLARVMPNQWLYNYFVIGITIPVQVIIIPTFVLVRSIGLVNNLFTMVLLYSATSLPLAVFILTGFMRSIPRELDEAAAVDGASFAQTFFRIILPMSRPALAVVGTLTFLYCWNEYLLALVMIASQPLKLLPQAIAALKGQYSVDYGLQMSGLVLAVIPVIIVYILFQEQFIKGATAGAVKD
jgi:raffinose/stachyose/melibiose transport system permease protein